MQLAQRLAQKGLLNEADLPRIAEAHAANPDKPLHELLIEKGFAKEEHVLAALAEEFGLDVVDLTQTDVADETLQAMPLKLVHRHNLMPIARTTARSSWPPATPTTSTPWTSCKP